MTKHLDTTYVTVLPRVRVRGWDGDPNERQVVPEFDPVTLRDALETVYPGEACMVSYVDPRRKPLPRLNKSALASIACQPERLRPACEVFLFDVDYPNHNVPHEGWYEEMQGLVPPEYREHMGTYRTPHGMRLLFLPPEPVPLLEAASAIEWFHRQFRSWNIPVDAATKDAQRLFKCPHALGRDLPCDWDTLSPLPKNLFISDSQRAVVEPTSLGAYVTGKQPAKQTVEEYKITRKDVRLLRDKALADHLYESRLTAPEGQRHATLLSAAIQIIRDTEQMSPDFAFKLLAKTLPAMNRHSGRDIDHAELWRICEWACAQVAGNREERREKRSTFFDRLADKLDVPVSDAMRCVILDTGSQYYVYDEEREDYSLGYTNSRQLLPALKRHAPAVYFSVDSPAQALEDYSSPVSTTKRSYLTDVATYDPDTYELVLPAQQIRSDLQPRYHKQIHEWLIRLAPDEKSRSRLLDWLAAFPDLSLPTCALYIDGPKSIGKGLLAHGLSKLWGASGPVSYQSVIDRFNPELARCPLVVADESVPKDAFGEDDSGIFRRLIGSPTHRIEEKFQSGIELEGYLRVLITANNDEAFQIRETLTKKDLEAVTLRIGYIALEEGADGSCPPRDYLESLVEGEEASTVRDVTQPWIDDGLIAEHVLWLAQNRAVVPGARFIVEGWASDLTRNLATSHGATPTVVSILCQAVTEDMQSEAVRWRDGFVYVSSSLLPREQDRILGYKRKKFAQGTYTTTLKSLSNDEQARLKTHSGKYRRYWKIPGEELARFAEGHGYVGERDEFVELVSRENEHASSLPSGAGMQALNRRPEESK